MVLCSSLRRSAVLAALFFLPVTWLWAQKPGANPPIDLINLNGGKFIYGTYYYPDHWPASMWEKDAQMMQDAGINLVKTGEGAWATFEPSEGQFDFAWMDRAIKVLAAHGIKVILGTPSYSPPAWLYAKYPDVGAVDIHGVRYTFGQRQVQNLSSRHYVDAVKRIVTAEGEHYANNPNVIAFSIDNEIGVQYSYDDLTRADFNDWLKEKYGTIQNVSDAWGGAFWGMELSAWNQVPIPWNDETPNPSMALDFRRFNSDLTNDFVAMQADILHKVAPSKATTHNASSSGMTDTVDYSKLFAPLTFAALDNYRTYSSPNYANYFGIDIWHDLIRGLNQQNFMVMEQMMGLEAWDSYFSINPDPPLYRTWTYQAIAHGADAINYYRWRQNWFGTEQLSVSILNWDSYAGDRYKVVAQVGQELPKITKLIQGSKVNSDVAMLVSPDSRWSFLIQPHTRKFKYEAVALDYYKALRQLRTNVDLIFPQQDFSHYKMIVAPALLVVDRDLGARLTDFVKNGGTLVLTYLSGYKDEKNWDTQTAVPRFLKDVTGAAVHDFDPQLEQKQEIVMSDGTRYPAEIWYDILTPETASTLATYANRYYKGQAAITKNHYGKGTTYYIGTKTSSEEFYQKMMTSALTDACIKPGQLVPNGVQVATREKAGEKIYFLLNYEDKTKTVPMGEELVNAFTGKNEPANVELGPYDVKILTAR